ncbi:MAG: hypothetical protein RLZZ399_2420, partial [Verrucomicrobiota bacterium]
GPQVAGDSVTGQEVVERVGREKIHEVCGEQGVLLPEKRRASGMMDRSTPQSQDTLDAPSGSTSPLFEGHREPWAGLCFPGGRALRCPRATELVFFKDPKNSGNKMPSRVITS